MEIKKEINFLLGKSLIQICYGLYQIQLNFNDNIRIEVADSLIFQNSDGIIYNWEYNNGRNSLPINSLLECTVSNAEFLENNLLILFNNNESLKILSGGDKNESYIVHNGTDFEVIY